MAAGSFLLLMLLHIAPALAADANTAPPHVSLIPGGRHSEGLIGPGQQPLAYFETEGPDSGSAYRAGSEVSFTCLLDGGRVSCPNHFDGCCRTPAVTARRGSAAPTPPLPPYGYGRFVGNVPAPAGLASGPHTISVVAADEDGADPAPPSITVIYDTNPPGAPQLTQMPPRRSHIRKPIFRFTANDGERLVGSKDRIFAASLRRLSHPGMVYRENSSASSFFEVWFPRCPTLLTCSTRAQASYMASEHWYSYGEPERLTAGLYELRVRAIDAVGNKSPITTYRFRILRGKASSGAQP